MSKFTNTIILLALSATVNAQNVLMDSIEIIGNQLINTNQLSTTRVAREKIDRSTTNNVLDELKYVSNVNVESRGILGTQSDISLRGSTYEQIGILFNGIKINNPQTGHNNMVFPVSLFDIDIIDVVKGGASKYFGANAYAGIISLRTTKPKKNELIGDFSLGSFSTSSNYLGYNIREKYHWHKLSASLVRSKGYQNNTDNESWQLFSENHIELSSGLDIFGTISVHSKKFGANSFYSLRFPNQYEELQSYFFNVGVKKNGLKFNLYWNQINDYFILRREDPSFYKNTHYTDARGGILSYAKVLSRKTTLNSSIEYRNEAIKSSNLGIRNRNNFNANTNIGWDMSDKTHINLGGNINKIDDFNPFLTGGLHASHQVSKFSSIYSSVNSSFRVPSFTELYYTSPTDTGNSNLEAETAINFDVGYNLKRDLYELKLNGYLRWSNNQIDWIRPTNSSTYFEAQNIGVIRSRGIEFSTGLNLNKLAGTKPITRLVLSYAYNNFSIDSNSNLRYSYSLLRHQFITSLYLKYSNRVYQSFFLRVEDRPSLQGIYAILDSRIEYRLKHINLTSIYLNIQNLLGTDYQYFSGLPMPGINFMAGLKFRL